MAIPNHIRGALLEEIVLHLLDLVGYRVVNPGEEGTRGGAAGLEVQGRGEWHQIDGLAAFDRTPAFMYPLRLIVEAKCYREDRTVGIPIVRNSVGVLKDISENYFTHRSSDNQNEIQIPRFNYHSAIFSTSGYSANAQRYALAHQIFLIQYEKIGLLQPIIRALLALEEEHFSRRVPKARTNEVRREFRSIFKDENVEEGEYSVFSEDGIEFIRHHIAESLLSIRGSYFGVLQGRWPMHLLCDEQLPMGLFMNSDELSCQITRDERGTWGFTPSQVNPSDNNWFRLEFDLPKEIALMTQSHIGDAELLHVKQQNFSYLDLAGKIGNIHRSVRLRMDPQWAEELMADIRRRDR